MNTPKIEIEKLTQTADGIALARVTIKHIAITSQSDGIKVINIQDGPLNTEFFLTEEQCAHIAALLTP